MDRSLNNIRARIESFRLYLDRYHPDISMIEKCSNRWYIVGTKKEQVRIAVKAVDIGLSVKLYKAKRNDCVSSMIIGI